MTTDAMEPPYEPSKTLTDSAELLRAYLTVPYRTHRHLGWLDVESWRAKAVDRREEKA